MKKLLVFFLTTVMLINCSVSQLIVSETVSADETVLVNNYVAIDINGSENREELKDASFEDWTIYSTEKAVYESNGLTFSLYNAKGEAFQGTQNKKLMTATSSPVLTCDGVYYRGAITLEIAGLSKGTHTISTYHNLYNETAYSLTGDINVSVNNEIAETVHPTYRVADDLDTVITYISFEVSDENPVLITIAPVKSGFYDIAVLNAFEIDGAHPRDSIKNPVPADHEAHFDQELVKELSWDSGDGAVSHDVYLGTDYYSVFSANHDSLEFKGNQTENSYPVSDLSHMERYYWRIDEIDAEGNVTKGKVMWFEVVHLAFPSAEGYGRFAKAGRGGVVYEVTTLEDGYEPILDEEGNPVVDENGKELKQPIPGSLRYAVESMKGPRIVVFKVGGVIELKSRLIIPNDGGNIYVAGQTAPGDGITLINYDFGALGADDVVIRDVRVRIGDSVGASLGGMGLGSCNHSIIDHCSISWSIDEGFSSRNAKNITFQYNIIAEALNNSVKFKGSETGKVEDRVEGETERHSFAASISGHIGSFHHNLLTNCTGRNWSLAGGLESDGSPAGYLDISNNVVYNWKDRTNDGGVYMLNLVGNYYKTGHVTTTMNIARLDTQTITYAAGNMFVTKDGEVLLNYDEDGWDTEFIKHNSSEPLTDLMKSEPLYPNYITLERADEAYETVLKKAGAVYPERDYLDSRYIDEVRNSTYTYKGSKDSLPGIIDSQEDVGGYPDETTFKGGEAPLDTDHDGMPDEWEVLHGLNPEDYNDNSVITLSAEGYTNVEMYLNELMGDTLVWSNENQMPDEPYVPATPTSELTDTPEPTEDFGMLGDVDETGYVDAADALLVLKHAAKLSILDEKAFYRADVTKDSNVEAQDALEILKYAAHLITEF